MGRNYYIFLLLTLIFMTSDQVVGFDGLRAVAQVPLSPISYGLYQTGFRVKEVIDFVVSLPRVYTENSTLRSSVIELEEQVVQLDALTRENKSLRQQLNVLGERDSKRLLARVIGVDDKADSVLLIIDAGATDGVSEGMIVVSGEHLIGRVTEVKQSHAFVLPIFASSSKVPVKVISLDETVPRGLLIGEFNHRLILSDVLQEFTLNSGDLVVTSGEGGVYPAGLLVGRVGDVLSTDNEIFKRASVESVWEMQKLQTVFIQID